MIQSNKPSCGSRSCSSLVLRGLIAGAAGSATLLLAHAIARQKTHAQPDTKLADAAARILHTSIQNPERANRVIALAYQSAWGLPRAVLSRFGVSGATATAIHFGCIYATVLIAEPALHISPPLRTWRPKKFALQAAEHLLYAAATGLVFDSLTSKEHSRWSR